MLHFFIIVVEHHAAFVTLDDVPGVGAHGAHSLLGHLDHASAVGALHEIHAVAHPLVGYADRSAE